MFHLLSVMLTGIYLLPRDVQSVNLPMGHVLSCSFPRNVLKTAHWGVSIERHHSRSVSGRCKQPDVKLTQVQRASRILAHRWSTGITRAEKQDSVWPKDAHNSAVTSVVRDCVKTLLAGSLLVLTCVCSPSEALAQDTLTTQLSSENPVFDAAKILPSRMRGQLNSELREFEQKNGWRIRLLTGYEGELSLGEDDVRAAWRPNPKSVIVGVDPSSPNIVAFRFIGADVQQKLRRQFWIELQSRFGNIYYVRDEGEASAVMSVTKTIEECLLKPEGCRVVPGLPIDQFYFTLVLSIAGGLVFGFSSKLEPAGWVQQRWVWTLLFSPLWIILFVSLGIGPVVSRTTDPLPVVGNVVGFLGGAFLFRSLPNFPPKDPDVPSEGDPL